MKKKIEVDEDFRESEEELLRRLEQLQLSREEREIMKTMLIGSYFHGGAVRQMEIRRDIELSSEIKEFFEANTYEFLKDKNLRGRKRWLACDLAAYGYSEGVRSEGKWNPYPESFARMMKAVS